MIAQDDDAMRRDSGGNHRSEAVFHPLNPTSASFAASESATAAFGLRVEEHQHAGVDTYAVREVI